MCTTVQQHGRVVRFCEYAIALCRPVGRPSCLPFFIVQTRDDRVQSMQVGDLSGLRTLEEAFGGALS